MKKWEWLGQSLALDFANTRPDVSSGGFEDLFAESRGIDEWLAQQRELGRPAPTTASDSPLYTRLRNAVCDAFGAVAQGLPIPPESVTILNGAASDCPVVPVLTPTGQKAQVWEPTDAGIRGAIACDAIELLGTDKMPRLRRCGAPACGMFYLEQRVNQRWCSSSCGNRARVYRHLAQRR